MKAPNLDKGSFEDMQPHKYCPVLEVVRSTTQASERHVFAEPHFQIINMWVYHTNSPTHVALRCLLDTSPLTAVAVQAG